MTERAASRDDVAWRLAPEDVERAPAFEAGLPALASRCGRPVEPLRRELRAALHELRTAHSPRVYARLVAAGRRLMASGYERVAYDAAQVERLRGTLATRATVVLSSHRSYLDGGAFTVGFADHGLPALTVFAGANLDFWPVGTLWRRANAVLIRRAGPSPVHAYALRHCVATLVAQRRPLQWFVEGTRSRSGLLGRARLGLLVYVVEAYRDGRVDDVALQPASIAYDQLREVDEYAAAARGATKPPETLGWLVRFVRAQRGRHGAIHVRFGEPVSLRAFLGPPDALPPPDSDAARAALQSLAREVLRRIDAATPVTATAIVCGVLLGARGGWTSRAALERDVRDVVAFVRARGIPDVAGDLGSGHAGVAAIALGAVLDAMTAHGLVETAPAAAPDGEGAGGGGTGPGRTDAGARYRVPPGRELQAAYHRNASLSHFVPAAAGTLLDALLSTPAAARACDALHALLAAFVDLGEPAHFAASVRAAADGPRLPDAFAAAVLGPLLEAAATVDAWRASVCDAVDAPAGPRRAAADSTAPADAPEAPTGALGALDAAALAACEALGFTRIADGTHVHPDGVSRALYACAARLPPGASEAWRRARDAGRTDVPAA